jgi:hypothetical protein
MTSLTRNIRIELPNGATAFVEAIELCSREVDVAQVNYLTEQFHLSDISKTLEGIVELVNNALLSVKPKKTSVELGIKIAMEAGKLTALIINGTGEANLKINLEW